jgi:nicotinate-nucleotide adenylyltransferase
MAAGNQYCLAVIGVSAIMSDRAASPLGIFGGTFDPIHYGHLRTAFEMLQSLRFGEVSFMPCGNPPHRGSTYADA